MDIKFNEFRLLRLNPLQFIEFLLLLYISTVIIFSMIPVGNIISRLIGIVFFYCFIILVLIGKNSLFINREIKLIIVWFIFCLISGLVAIDVGLVVNKLITIIQLILFFIAGYSILLKSRININTILYLIIISVFFIFIFGFVSQYNPDVLVTKNRITSTAGDPNFLSLLGAFAFIFSLFLFHIDKNKLRLVLLVPIIVVILYGIVLTQSRQGIVLVLVGAFLYSLIQIIYRFKNTRNKKRYMLKLTLYFLSAIIFISALIFIFQQTEYSYRIQAFIAFIKLSFQSSNEHISRIIDYSAYERKQLLKYGIKIWFDHPIMGIGLDNFRTIIKHYNPAGNRLYSHNNYIELLTTIGTIGAVVYYAIYFSIFTKLFRLQKKLKVDSNELKVIQLFLTMMLSIMVVELVTVTYYTKFIWILFVIIVAFSDRIIEKYQINLT